MAKIGCAVAGAGAVGLLGAGGIAVYTLVGYFQGVSLLRAGYAAMAARDYNRAIACFDQALQKPLGRPYRVQAYYNRGAAHNQRWQLTESISDFTRALELDPDLKAAYVGRGWAYQQKADAEKALPDFNEAIRRDPNEATSYYTRGFIYYEKKDLKRATADFAEAIRCNPRDPNGFIMRGLCYSGLNDLDRALANFDAAIMLDPDNARAFSERAIVYRRKGETAESRHDLAEARRLTRTFASSKEKHPPPFGGRLEKAARLNVSPLPKLQPASKP